MIKNIKYRNLVIIMLITAAAVLIFSGCPMVPSEDNGVLYFPDFKDQIKLYGDTGGAIEYGEVNAGDSVVKTLKIENTGTGDLVITNISFDNSIFSFKEGSVPDLPVIIPPGKIIDNIYLEFSPVTAGEQSGNIILTSSGLERKINLSGTGMWVLTLNASNVGGSGKILSPIEVLSGETEQITTSTGIVELAVEPASLNVFDTWTVDSYTGTEPVFTDNDLKAQTSIITIYSHTEITAGFLTSVVRVPGDQPNIQAGIDACNADLNDALVAVVVQAGTYNNGADLILKPGASVWGGYNIGFTGREYQTLANRNNATYQTIINFTGDHSIKAADSDIGNDITVEGFTIQKAAAGDNPLFSIESSSTPIIQYNTITGNGSGSAVKCDSASPVVRNNVITGGDNPSGDDHASSTAVLCINSADPRIEANTITGGTATGNYSKAYTVRVEEGSSPVIYSNTITGGTASGTSGDSFGIRNDFECEPVIVGNSITGGTVTDSGDGKTYGIFCILNGKIDIYYNDIDGGTGGTASHSVFASQGMNLYMEYNNIFTTAGEDTDRYGIYLGINGRLRKLFNSGIYDCPVLLYKYLGNEEFTDIEDVNDECHTDETTENVAEHITYTLPLDIEALIEELENN